MQTVLVAAILALCAAYVARRLWHLFRRPPGSVHCAGCPLAGQCGTCPEKADGAASAPRGGCPSCGCGAG